MKFRQATENDTALILSFIRALAAYEKLSHEVVATEEILHEWLFLRKKAEVLFVLEGEREVGFALFFHNFSTFLGRAGIYLEDLFVLPEYRGKGYGKGLIRELARLTVELPGLEHPQHPFLRKPGCRADGRLAHLPRHRGYPAAAGQ